MPLIRPQNLDAERAVISVLLADHTKFYEMARPLRTEMFFGIDNALVYKTIDELFSQGKTPDVLLLREVLGKSGDYGSIGGDAYFDQLPNGSEFTLNFDEYVGIIADSFMLRQIIDAGVKITNSGYTDSADVALDTMFRETNVVLDSSTAGSNSAPVDAVMGQELDAFMHRLENPGGNGIKTMFSNFDMITGGLHKTDEVIIAARPSVGKTTLALRWLMNLAKQGVPVAIFSYEMSKPQLMQRMMSMESGVGLMRIRNGMVSGADVGKVIDASTAIMSLPIHINSNVGASVTEVISDTKRLVRSKGVQAIAVDYLQLMPHRTEYATQDLGQIARRLKTLAMSADITVLAISQLNRMVETRSDKIPLLSDLRQSGNLEEHADMVLMIYREEMYNRCLETEGKADLLIRKNRNGPIGSLPMRFSANSVDFAGCAMETLGI